MDDWTDAVSNGSGGSSALARAYRRLYDVEGRILLREGLRIVDVEPPAAAQADFNDAERALLLWGQVGSDALKGVGLNLYYADIAGASLDGIAVTVQQATGLTTWTFRTTTPLRWRSLRVGTIASAATRSGEHTMSVERRTNTAWTWRIQRAVRATDDLPNEAALSIEFASESPPHSSIDLHLSASFGAGAVDATLRLARPRAWPNT